MTDIVVTVGAATDTGRVREHNEDSWHADGRVFAVADGMGGHAAGEVASAIAVECLAAVADAEPLSLEEVVGALEEAHRRILREGAEAPGRRGMGTTVTGVARVHEEDSDCWAVFNVGDSRVYRLAGNRLEQVTTDHSEVQALVDAGLISAEEARQHPARNVITRSLGMTGGQPSVDLWLFPATQQDETFLVCSDGLTNEVGPAELAAAVVGGGDPQGIVNALIMAANESGGRDNITAVLVRSRLA